MSKIFSIYLYTKIHQTQKIFNHKKFHTNVNFCSQIPNIYQHIITPLTNCE